MLGTIGVRQRGRLWKPVTGLIVVMLTLGLSTLAGPAAHAGAGGTTLSPGQTLTSGQSLVDGNFSLVMGTDGNLVLDQFIPIGGSSHQIWATGTSGHSGAYLIMQGDGNLVLYSASGTALWNSGTSGHNNAGIYAILGSDGQILVQTNSVVYWISQTSGASNGSDKLFGGTILNVGQTVVSENGDYTLIEQLGFIELVHSTPCCGPNYLDGLIWYKGQNGFETSYASMQTDSNFVQYGGSPPSKYIIWASYTNGNSSDGAYLKVQNDGNVVIYSKSAHALWASNTAGG